MKTKGKVIIFLFIILTGYSCTTSRQYANRGNIVTTQMFYDELSPYGDWVHNREYGYVWMPHAGRNFYPYASNGRWVFTNYGWTWFSDYEWGWAPFHYGRWDYDPQYGWFWFPGDEWAPAWVTWRHGDGYFGWSPMRPESAYGTGYRNNYYDDLFRWVFVRERDFGRQNIERYYVNQRRNDEIYRSTRVLDDYRTDGSGRKIYAGGPDPRDVENLSGRRIQQVQVRDSNVPGRRLNNNQLEIYRPRVERPEGQRPAPSRITDIKEIRPMRERERVYQPEEEIRNEGVRDYSGQGERDINREQVQNRREKEVRRQYEEKQLEMQRRQEERELENQRRATGVQRQEADREYQQNRSERVQKIEQERRTIQKERDRNIRELNDTSGTKRSQSVPGRSVRQNRR